MVRWTRPLRLTIDSAPVYGLRMVPGWVGWNIVLIIEPDADLRQTLRELLEPHFEVTEASKGRDGLRQLHQTDPGLVILDAVLPDLDGWQVLAASSVACATWASSCLAPSTTMVTRPECGRRRLLRSPHEAVQRGRVAETCADRPQTARTVKRLRAVTTFDDGPLHVDLVRQEVTVDGEAHPFNTKRVRRPCHADRAPNGRGTRLSTSIPRDRKARSHRPNSRPRSFVKAMVLRIRYKLWPAAMQGGPLSEQPIETLRGFGYPDRSL